MNQNPLEMISKDNNYSKEIEEYCEELRKLIDRIDICLDKDTGSILHLPFKGSLEEQPLRRFTIFRNVQSLWISTVNNIRKLKK